MLALTIRVDDMRAKRAVGALQRAFGGDLSPVMRAIGTVAQRGVAQAFRESRDPATGRPWAKLKRARQGPRGDASRGKGSRVLLNTGQLRNSLVSSVPAVTRDSVRIGTSLVYARIHQTGGTIRPKNSKYLAVPLTKEAAKAGSARRWIQRNERSAGTLMYNTTTGAAFVAKTGDRGAVLGESRRSQGEGVSERAGAGNWIAIAIGSVSANGAFTQHFHLTSRPITIPARPYLGVGKATMQRMRSVVFAFAQRIAGGGAG